MYFHLQVRGFFSIELYSASRKMSSMTPWMESLIDKTIQTLKDDTVKKKIQILILQPFVQYIIELIFPYIIIMCVVFGLLVMLMASILGVLVYKSGTPVGVP